MSESRDARGIGADSEREAPPPTGWQAGQVGTADVAADPEREAPATTGWQAGQVSTADVAAAGPATPSPASPESQATPLFPADRAQGLRSRWGSIQGGFVDEPRRAVEQADGLVAEVVKDLAESFASERAELEHQWGRGDDISTEDLRLALRRYRSFFDRLLSV